MTDKELARVVELVESGHLMTISGPYVDSFAIVFEDGGEWRYYSQVWSEEPVKNLSVSRLNFYKPVEFEREPS